MVYNITKRDVNRHLSVRDLTKCDECNEVVINILGIDYVLPLNGEPVSVHNCWK